MKSIEELRKQDSYTKEDVAYVLDHLYGKVDMSGKYRIFELVEELELPDLEKLSWEKSLNKLSKHLRMAKISNLVI